MKPEQYQEYPVLECPVPEPLDALGEQQQSADQRAIETAENTFEAILEAYAQDPDRWDGLE